MFTGIIEEVGFVKDVEGQRLVVQAYKVMTDLKLGDSIAVNGACLTVVQREDNTFTVELSPETLRRTSLGVLSMGHKINLERPLAVSDRLGGHIVQGHVDATGSITSSKPDGDCVILRIRSPKRLMPYIVEKGFVTVDGISLTVVKRGASSFTLSVIPYTLQNTNLLGKTVGDRVNLEADIVAKYVESILAR
ncbi:MAG: riboflavin synthase [Chloroflexi bacterium]|nr:riboflavin synthase [Chloroflexota bacterium]MCH8349030.1 riboflavin synthase [Chloroflexota bacterium]MCI0823848.1 riboflavin synthase [Chloroflexota bacterium]MCI0879201.1 riboflavin synthase [Chloroflexota bacterium]